LVVSGYDFPGLLTRGHLISDWYFIAHYLPRLFRMLDPEQFRATFQRFMAGFSEQCEGVVAIDGKVLRRSFDRASGKSPLHMVSAWGCEQRLVLAQIATDVKSNEITAVPKLLEMLRLKGTIVTADALNCQSPSRSSIRAATKSAFPASCCLLLATSPAANDV
jgi:hypothetical protein